jgi:hypothetical protein
LIDSKIRKSANFISEQALTKRNDNLSRIQKTLTQAEAIRKAKLDKYEQKVIGVVEKQLTIEQ